MKKLTLLIIGALIVALSINFQTAMAIDDIASTKHNLQNVMTLDGTDTYYDTVENQGEVCVYCHTPHNKNTGASAPLWNRNVTTGTAYTVYDSSVSSTINMTTGNPDGVSLACLSCHDGNIALDAIVNQPGLNGDTGGWTPSSVTMRDTTDANYNPVAALTLRHFVGKKTACEAFGISRATFYRHFDNKNAPKDNS